MKLFYTRMRSIDLHNVILCENLQPDLQTFAVKTAILSACETQIADPIWGLQLFYPISIEREA